MATLSREVASWINSQPGPIYAYTENQVWDQTVRQFQRDRRWKAEVPLADFMLFMRNCGYTPEIRPNLARKEGEPMNFAVLALPERHRGF